MAGKRKAKTTQKDKRASKPRVRVQPTAVAVEERPKTLSAAGSLSRALAGIIAGGWASDHRVESEHVTGWTYIAIRAICLQAAQATVSVFDDRGPTGEVMKSERQVARQRFRGDPVFRMTTKNYWRATKSLYGQENRSTNPLPDRERIVRLMKAPNRGQSGAMFRYEQVMQLQATGTCLVWNQPNRFGTTAARYVVPTAITSPVMPNSELPNGGFRVDPSASRFRDQQDALGFVEMRGFMSCIGRTIPAEQCQVIRWPHPHYKDDGLSPLAACAQFKDLSDQVNLARWSQMVNGFEPSLFIEIDKDFQPDEDELAAALQKLQDKYGGAVNHRKILALLGANKATMLSTSPKDMDYQQGHMQSRDGELAIQGVPPVMAGIQEAGAFAAYYASLKQGIGLTCQPIFDVLAEEDTRWFTNQRPDPLRTEVEGAWIQEYPEGTTVEMEAAPVDDPQVLEQQLQTDLSARIRTKDELRSMRGLPLWGGKRGNEIAGAELPVAAAQQNPESAPRPNLFQLPALQRDRQDEQRQSNESEDESEQRNGDRNGDADLSPAGKSALLSTIDRETRPDVIRAAVVDALRNGRQ